jgi:hypothetical protein
MPTLPDDPLRRVTLNLYEADVAWLIKTYGDGWTVRIRQHIHNEIVSRKEYDNAMKILKRPTLGDLNDQQPPGRPRNPATLPIRTRRID